MLKSLRAVEPIVAETFAEADRVLTPLLGKPLSEFIFVDENDNAALEQAEADLRQTAITQPAVLAVDIALTRLMAAYGISPDMTMGHSLGEYGALVAAGGLPFEDALMAVSARGREMTRVALEDNGKMAAVFAPLPDIERVLGSIHGYAVIANINSDRQAVIGGSSKSIEEAVKVFQESGFTAVLLPVSHAFSQYARLSPPPANRCRECFSGCDCRLRACLWSRMWTANSIPDANAPSKMAAILGQQVASPVQFVQGLRRLQPRPPALAYSSKSGPRRHCRALSTMCSAIRKT